MVSMDQKDLTYRGPDLKLFVRDVRDRQGKKRPIMVRSWATIKDVKDTIQQLLHVPPSAQRLYFGPLLTSGVELPNHRTLHDVGIYRSGETMLLDIKGSHLAEQAPTSALSCIFSFRSSNGNDICISSSMIDSTPRPLRTLVQQARRGFNLGLKPEFVIDGSGGTYFLHDARKNKIAVFKPADEEPYAANNPRGYLRQPDQHLSLREGVVPGEACIREVAAYLLDHGGVSGVPMTTLAEARHPTFNTNGSRLTVAEGGASIGSHSISPIDPNAPVSPIKPPPMKKPGSFQEFVNSECTMDDISPSLISAEEVHRIAILDIRVMNADRNSANLLVRRRPDNHLELVPIDHGFCLRSVCDVSWMDWCWLDWPQLKKPLSDDLKKYVMGLDIEADARLLQERLNICQEAVDIFRASSSFLKAGVKAGLSLYEIAVMCCRNDNLGEVPSKLERLSTMASELSVIAVENERWHHTAASRALVEQLTPKVGFFKRNNRKQRIYKSASSAEFASSEFTSFGSNSFDDHVRAGSRGSPGMAQSSASESSSDGGVSVGEKDDCDCEVWAAGVIADVSVDQIVPPRREMRSGSVASDESSDAGSPKGFWHIRPGSSPPLGSDDGSITWSPQSTDRVVVDAIPSVSFHGDLVGGNVNMPTVTFAAGLEPSPQSTDRVVVDDIPSVPFDGGPGENVKTPTVSFADGLGPRLPFLPPPATVNASKFKTDGLGMDFSGLQRQESGVMARSKSYSALSQTFSSSPDSSSGDQIKQKKKSPDASSEQYEHYRKYFLNFVDLVIARETTAAVHQSKHGQNAKRDSY